MLVQLSAITLSREDSEEFNIFLMSRNLISMHFTPSNMIKKEQYDSLVR